MSLIRKELRLGLVGFAVSVGSFARVTEAFWDEGHMLVAAIAELVLNGNSELPLYTQYQVPQKTGIRHRLWETNNADPAVSAANVTLELATSSDEPAQPLVDIFPWEASDGPRTVSLINDILSAWAVDYQPFSTLISSAVWADHIKCKIKSSFCSDAIQRFDGIEIFNYDHFVDLINKKLEPATLHDLNHALTIAFRRPGNAAWLLRQAAESLSVSMVLLDAGDGLTDGEPILSTQEIFSASDAQLGQAVSEAVRNYTNGLRSGLPAKSETPPNSLDGPPLLSRSNRHLVDLSSIGQMTLSELQDGIDQLNSNKGTRFSYNLMLRFFIHVFGDIHQPLHATLRVDPECFPRGDQGGNGVHVRLNPKHLLGVAGGPVPTNLHQLWDSAAGMFSTSYPDFSLADARAKARELIKAYPPPLDPATGKYSAFDPSMRTAFITSFNLSREFVYSEIDKLSRCPTQTHPYEPSDAYVSQLRDIVQRRIAHAGYELACFLSLFAKNVPPAISASVPILGPAVLEEELLSWKQSALISWGVTGTIGLVFVLYWAGSMFNRSQAATHRRVCSDEILSSVHDSIKSVTMIESEAPLADLGEPLLRYDADSARQQLRLWGRLGPPQSYAGADLQFFTPLHGATTLASNMGSTTDSAQRMSGVVENDKAGGDPVPHVRSSSHSNLLSAIAGLIPGSGKKTPDIAPLGTSSESDLATAKWLNLFSTSVSKLSADEREADDEDPSDYEDPEEAISGISVNPVSLGERSSLEQRRERVAEQYRQDQLKAWPAAIVSPTCHTPEPQRPSNWMKTSTSAGASTTGGGSSSSPERV